MSRKETARHAPKAEPIPTFASEAEERRSWESDDSTDPGDLGPGRARAAAQPRSLDQLDLTPYCQ